MPLFISVAMIREDGQIFTHVFTTVAPTEAVAIERSKADLGAHHGGKDLMGASIYGVAPDAIREAYAELITDPQKESMQ